MDNPYYINESKLTKNDLKFKYIIPYFVYVPLTFAAVFAMTLAIPWFLLNLVCSTEKFEKFEKWANSD